MDDIVPKHVAAIMDGNARWAACNDVDIINAYAIGADIAERFVLSALRNKVRYVTLFAFSTENHGRDENYIKCMMDLFCTEFSNRFGFLVQHGVNCKFIGRVHDTPLDVQSKMNDIMHNTSKYDKIYLNIAINYGGKAEIIDAVKRMIADNINTHSINEALLSEYMYSQDFPDPDLIIRTGGEQRLSNFLLWQSSYAELYFSDVMWPDFRENEFNDALVSFKSRTRRFGK